MQGLLGELFNSNLSPDQKAIRDQGLYAGLLNAGGALTAASAPGGNHNPAALFSQAARGFAGGNMQGRAMVEQAAQKARQQQAIQGLLSTVQDPQLRALANAYPQMFAKHKAESAFRAQKPPAPLTANNFVKVAGPDGKPMLVRADHAEGRRPYVKPERGAQPLTLMAKIQADLDAKRITPEQAEAQRQIAMKPLVSNVDLDADRRKSVRKRYDEARKTAADLRRRDEALAQMEKLTGKVYSGWGASEKLTAQKMLGALGFSVDAAAIGQAEQFNNLAMDQVMQLIAQTKGSISEKEMAAFERASPSLRNTPEGNRQIIKFARHRYRKEMALKRYAQELVRSNPKITVYEIDKLVDKKRASMKQFEFDYREPEVKRLEYNPKTGKIE